MKNEEYMDFNSFNRRFFPEDFSRGVILEANIKQIAEDLENSEKVFNMIIEDAKTLMDDALDLHIDKGMPVEELRELTEKALDVIKSAEDSLRSVEESKEDLQSIRSPF